MLMAFSRSSRTRSAISRCASGDSPLCSSQASSWAKIDSVRARARARRSSWAGLSVRSILFSAPRSYTATRVRMMNATAEGVNGVQSVQRAAALLEAIAGAPEPLTAPELAERCGLNRTVPLHATSTGKALLAFLPPEELDTAFAQSLPQFTDRTITDPTELRAELDRVRRRGYAVSRGELETALWGASAPVLDRRNRPLAVVSVWGAEGRLRTRGRLDELGRAVASTATAIAA